MSSPCLSLPICSLQDDGSITHKMLPFSLNYATAALCTSRADLMEHLYSFQNLNTARENLPTGIISTGGICGDLKALQMALYLPEPFQSLIINTQLCFPGVSWA